MPKVDGLVKSLQSRHSREGGNPQTVQFPGFPLSREWRKWEFSDFLRVCQSWCLFFIRCWTFDVRCRSLRLPRRSSF